MSRKRLFLLLNSMGELPQRTKGWDTFDVARIQAEAESRGFEVSCRRANEFLLVSASGIRGSVVHAATSMFPQYRAGFEAALMWAQLQGARVFPPFEAYLAYENKVVAAVVGASRGLTAPGYCLLQSAEDLDTVIGAIGFPCVWKLPWGSGSWNVRLVRSAGEAVPLMRKWLRAPQWGTRKPASIPSRAAKRFLGFHFGKGVGSVLCQEYVPSPGHDWKVLVWNDKASALKRANRKGDFRASGSGIFSYEHCPGPVLEQAYQSCRKLALGWGSFDILEGARGPTVIEWQAVHFGTLTTDLADHHYQRGPDATWRRVDAKVDMETEMVVALCEAAQVKASAPVVGPC